MSFNKSTIFLGMNIDRCTIIHNILLIFIIIWYKNIFKNVSTIDYTYIQSDCCKG